MLSLLAITVSIFTNEHTAPIAVSEFVATKLPASVVGNESALLASNRKYAIAAEQVYREFGITDHNVILALHVNAWHECRWNPKSVYTEGNGSKSMGWFQLNSGSSGRGYSRDTLLSVRGNVGACFAMTRAKQFFVWCRTVGRSASAGTIARRFAARVEICAKRFQPQRERTADKWAAAMKRAGPKMSK
jgi:hypothetical protein